MSFVRNGLAIRQLLVSEMHCEKSCFRLTASDPQCANLNLTLPQAHFWPIKASLPWLVLGIHLTCQSQEYKCKTCIRHLRGLILDYKHNKLTLLKQATFCIESFRVGANHLITLMYGYGYVWVMMSDIHLNP